MGAQHFGHLGLTKLRRVVALIGLFVMGGDGRPRDRLIEPGCKARAPFAPVLVLHRRRWPVHGALPFEISQRLQSANAADVEGIECESIFFHAVKGAH